MAVEGHVVGKGVAEGGNLARAAGAVGVLGGDRDKRCVVGAIREHCTGRRGAGISIVRVAAINAQHGVGLPIHRSVLDSFPDGLSGVIPRVQGSSRGWRDIQSDELRPKSLCTVVRKQVSVDVVSGRLPLISYDVISSRVVVSSRSRACSNSCSNHSDVEYQQPASNSLPLHCRTSAHARARGLLLGSL